MQGAAVVVKKHLFQTSRIQLLSDLSNPTKHCWLESATYRTSPCYSLYKKPLSAQASRLPSANSNISSCQLDKCVLDCGIKEEEEKQSPNVGQGTRQKTVLSVPSLQMPQDWVQEQKRLAPAFLYPGEGVKGDQGKDRAKRRQRAKRKNCGHSS